MKTSSNYGLKLMEGTDNVKRQDFVDNFTKIDTEMKNIDNKHSAYGTTSGTNTYTVSITGIKSLYDGLKVTVKIGATSTGASTLNINGLGAKTILDSLGNAITSGGLKAGLPYQLCYNGTNFIVLGKGGGGNATADKILSGYKATVDSGQVTGTMPNINNPTTNLNCGGSYTIPKGYHPGTEKVNANSLASQTQATAGAGDILSGETAIVNGNKVTGNIPIRNNGENIQNTYIAFNGENLFLAPPNGNYFNGASVLASASQVANVLGITSDKLVSGNSICGVNGSATIESLGGKRYKTGTFVNSSSAPTINFGFVPKIIVAYRESSNSSASYVFLLIRVGSGPFVNMALYKSSSAIYNYGFGFTFPQGYDSSTLQINYNSKMGNNETYTYYAFE